MSAPHKAQSPVGAGHCADENTDRAILSAAEKTGNKSALQDCRLPVGCISFPAEFLSKRAAAKYLALVREATRIDATVDLIVGPYRRRPDYLVRLGKVTARLPDLDAARRWLRARG